MTAQRTVAPETEVVPDTDQRIVLRGFSWEQCEELLRALGDESPGVRVAYLEGAVEIMSPSRAHERRKTMVARLIWAWAEEKGVSLNGYGQAYGMIAKPAGSKSVRSNVNAVEIARERMRTNETQSTKLSFGWSAYFFKSRSASSSCASSGRRISRLFDPRMTPPT